MYAPFGHSLATYAAIAFPNRSAFIPSVPDCSESREDMKKVLEDHCVLKGYVDFVGAQFHKAIDDEQQGHDKQVGREKQQQRTKGRCEVRSGSAPKK